MNTDSMVFVVDDDDSVRQGLDALLRSVDLPSKAFASANEFLLEPDPGCAACLVLDVRLPRASGFDVQEELRLRGRDIPIIFITGHGTIPMTVRAMKAGAVEFLTKPFSEDDLLEAIRRALLRDQSIRLRRLEVMAIKARFATLTPRERRVMALIVSGMLNKLAADELGTSEITVKVHRRRVMEKMQAKSLADLVRMAERMAVAEEALG